MEETNKSENEVMKITTEDQDMVEELFSMEDLKSDARAEFSEVMLDKLMPRMKVMVPKVIKMVDQDHELLINKAEMICIWRADDTGEMFVMKGKKTDINVDPDWEKCDINDLGGLFDIFLELMKKGKEGREEGSSL